MSCVTSVVKKYKQPRGGFISLKDYDIKQYDDGIILNKENIGANLIGTAVDYIFRFYKTLDFIDSFHTIYFSIKSNKTDKAIEKIFENYFKEVINIKQEKILTPGIINILIKISAYDSVARGFYPIYNEPFPDDDTINNVITMVKRCDNYFKNNVIEYGGRFNVNSYNDHITSGDYDLLTNDTIYDLKVSKNNITTIHSLQVLAYYYMSKEYNDDLFKNVNKIGFFNPRLNKSYIYDMENFKYENEIREKVLLYPITKGYSKFEKYEEYKKLYPYTIEKYKYNYIFRVVECINNFNSLPLKERKKKLKDNKIIFDCELSFLNIEEYKIIITDKILYTFIGKIFIILKNALFWLEMTEEERIELNTLLYSSLKLIVDENE